jgi:DNA polymerase-1
MQTYCEQDTAVGVALVHHPPAGVTPRSRSRPSRSCAPTSTSRSATAGPSTCDKAVELQARLSARREELEGTLRAIFKSWLKPVTKRGAVVVFTPKRDNRKTGVVEDAPFTKIVEVHFSPGSRQHIADRLQTLYGWKPVSFTPSGQPEVNEDTLLSLPQDIPGVKALMEYLLVTKRLGQLAEGEKAWLKLATDKRPSGGAMTGMQHIHGGVLQSGTITHRATHIYPNIGQVPKVGSPYGEECRALFTVPDGWVQVGADAKSLEALEMSHYMARFDGGAYGKVVSEGRNQDGTDIHSVNRDALGLVGKAGRDGAKTWYYAFVYGAGDLKLGRAVPPSPEEIGGYKKNASRWERAKKALAKRDEPTDDYTVGCLIKGGLLRARFLKNLPALGSLITEVKEKAKHQGYLRLHDGRRVPVRHAHAALNTLLQGSGSIVCKRWIVRFNRRLVSEFGPQGWDGQWAAMGWIHDEVQLAVRPAIAERVKEILVEEIRAVTSEFNLRVALDGEAKSGPHWAATH